MFIVSKMASGTPVGNAEFGDSLQDVELHPDIARFIGVMKLNLSWYGDDSWGKSAVGRWLKFYFSIRWFTNLLFFGTVAVTMYWWGKESLNDGAVIYLPVMFLVSFLSTVFRFSGKRQRNLVLSLNRLFLRHDEPWMEEVVAKYTNLLWKLVDFSYKYNMGFFIVYNFVPRAIESVLYYGFNAIDHYIIMPQALNKILEGPNDWGIRHHFLFVGNLWPNFEILFTVVGFIGGYSLCTVFCISELVIWKEKIKRLDLEKEGVEVELKKIISSHQDLIKLTAELKELYGLPCAILDVFSSASMTLTLFTVTTNREIHVLIAFCCGFSYYFFLAILACALGQLLEDESDGIFTTLYELPWYKCRPSLEKDINMMIRQARKTMVVDYHGLSRMNLANFMAIMKSAYSLFTLLQSVL